MAKYSGFHMPKKMKLVDNKQLYPMFNSYSVP